VTGAALKSTVSTGAVGASADAVVATLHPCIGVAASTTYSLGFSSQQYGMGAEFGYQLFPNMWISTGYNLLGFRNPDLTGEDITRKGAFIRLRFKFDENIFAPRNERRH